MTNINASILLDKRFIKKDKTYPVILVIYFNGTSRRYGLNNKLSLTEDDWNKINFRQPRKKSLKQIKNFIEEEKARALEVIKYLGENFSFSLFKTYFRMIKPYNKTICSVYDLFCKYIEDLKKNGQIGTASSYNTAMKSLKSFSPELDVSRVNITFLNKYECWMINCGNSVTTVGIYLRALRVIMNQAKDLKLISEDMYPFGTRYKRKYEIPAGNNIKHALNEKDIKTIKGAKCISSEEEHTRDLWLFSFYCNGMNMADIFSLKYQNITNDFFYFNRKKTLRSLKSQNTVEIFISEPIAEIINRWGNKDKALNNYIFNIYTLSMNVEEMFRQKQLTIRKINGYMERLGKRLNIKAKISTGVARHSYASILKDNGVSIEEISENLDHNNIMTTKYYLTSFSKEQKKIIAQKLVNLVK